MKFTYQLPIILLFLHCICQQGISQPRQHIDSLQLLLKTIPQDTGRIKVYGELCWYYAGTRDKLDSARLYADSIYYLSTKLEFEPAIILSHFYYGTIDRHEGNLPSSLDHFKKYVAYHEKNGNEHLIATGLYQVAVIQKSMGNLDESLSSFYKALEIHELNEFKYGIGFTLNAMAGIQREIKNYENAIKYFQRSIKLFTELNKKSDLAMSLENLGNVFAEMDQYDSALYYYNHAMVIDTKLDKKFGIASELENIGNLYFDMGQFKKALEYQLRSLDIRKHLPQQRELAKSHNKVGKLYSHLYAFDKAAYHLNTALQLSTKIEAKPLILEAYESLAHLAEIQKDYYNANEFQKLYSQLKDSIINEEKLKQINELETRYQTAQKDQEILLLSKENEIQEAKATRQSTLRNALIGFIVLIIALSVSILISLKQKVKNQHIISAKNEEIKTSNYKRKLTDLEMKALQSQMNPHFIFNCMNSINRMILAGESDEASRYLNKFSKLIRITLENSENSSISLEAELEMLETYIQLESVRFKGMINYTIQIDEALDPTEIYLPSMVLQPFIENAIWHGLMHKNEPGNINLAIHEENDLLRCVIEDDGVGREMALQLKEQIPSKNKSLGIKITEERLKLISKEKLMDWIKIEDLKDAYDKAIGTRVNLSIPIT